MRQQDKDTLSKSLGLEFYCTGLMMRRITLLSFISSGDVNRIYGTRVAIKTYKIIADLGKIKIIVQFKF